MNIFTDSKKIKKFILAMVILVLFNFCYPKNVQADLGDDIIAAPAKIFWWIEKGILSFLNNIFTNDLYSADEYVEVDANGYETTNMKVYLTPDNIIKGKFLLLDANIFKEITGTDSDGERYYDIEYDANGNPTGSITEGKVKLRETIAGWYYALRNLAIVALLSVLVYVGIRMILSTIAQDKAKYKIMFKDWLIALCLVVVMHYLMIGILNITSDLVNAIGGGKGVDMLGTLIRDITGTLSKAAGNANTPYTYTNPDGDIIDLGGAYAKIIVLAGIIIYTFIFAIKYLKREFTIIFLILLGPISCITYPIDKISDGKAQAFNKWFSEFLYQVIIQPFHLLLYIVLVSSAAELAEANVLYALLCFAIIIPAEKFIKEMFGFKDRLGSPLGAFATGAMASKLMSSLGKKGGSSGGKDEENESSLNELPPKTAKIPEVDGESKKGLEAGSDTDGNISGSSAAGAHQDSDDPIGDAEREAREERIAEGLEDNDSNMIAAGTGAAIGVAAADNTEGGKDVDKQLDQNEAYSNELKKQSMLGKISSVHNQRMAKKWGSTNRGRRWVNRGKKLAGNAAKFAVRTAGAGAGALVGGTIGMMTGNGAAGALLGAGIGRGAGNKVIKGATGAVRTAKDYRNAFRSDASREKQALRAFKADKQQVNRAVVNFRDVHKREPSARELDREMNDRFALSRYGIKDEKIDKAVGSYQKLREQQGMSQERALNQTAMAAKLADKEGLKGKDYMNKKTMNEAIETYTNNFVAKGIKDRNVAREQARKVFEQSAEIEGYKFALK